MPSIGYAERGQSLNMLAHDLSVLARAPVGKVCFGHEAWARGSEPNFRKPPFPQADAPQHHL